jgi:uncharacterized protein YeeX (DUF496 family)
MDLKKMNKDELKKLIEKAKKEYDSRIPYNLYKVRADLESWRNHYYEETTLLVPANSEDEAKKLTNEYIKENFTDDEEVCDITIQKVSPSDYDYEFDDEYIIIELERRYSG